MHPGANGTQVINPGPASEELGWLSVAQVAEMTTYSEETIRRLVRRGDLPASRRGGGRRTGRGVRILIHPSDVAHYFGSAA